MCVTSNQYSVNSFGQGKTQIYEIYCYSQLH